MFKPHRHIESFCTNCGKGVDTSLTDPDKRGPQGGDITICFYCHHLMAYNNDLTVRNLTDEEMLNIAGDERLVRTVNMLRAFDKRRKGKDNGKV